MTVRVPQSLPKKTSKAFREEKARILNCLDLPRLLVVIEGALHRKGLEDIMRKALRGRALKPGSVPRPELVAAIAEGFRLNDEIAFRTMKELDRNCQKERHIAASMAEEELEVRLSAYRAIDFRRERSRLIWGLLRDGRAVHQNMATQILDEAFASMAEAKKEEQQAAAPGQPESDAINPLKERLETFEAAVKEQAGQIKGEREAVMALEKERSELLARLGQRTKSLELERERRETAEAEVSRLREEVLELSDQVEKADLDALQTTIEERDQLRAKTRHLEKKVAHIERMTELQNENSALKEEILELKREAERKASEHEAVLDQIASKEVKAQKRAESLRASLRAARQLSIAATSPLSDEGPDRSRDERVGIFVDAANLSGSARREHGGKFDFLGLLPELVADRKRVIAVAYVVDAEGGKNESSGFQAFANSLRQVGYEVRRKQARKRQDGSKKADWDIGIAMEIVDLRSRIDTVILCTGDGDFLPLIHRLKKWGKRVELASHQTSTNTDLIRAVDEFISLDNRFRMRD